MSEILLLPNTLMPHFNASLSNSTAKFNFRVAHPHCELKDWFEQINLNLKEEAGLIYGQVFPSIDGSR